MAAGPGLLVALACYCVGQPDLPVRALDRRPDRRRVLQAFGGSGAIVLARAVVRDLYSGARAGKELSLMGLVMAFGPVSAPLIGGILHTLFGWRSSFAALLAFGIVLMVTVLRKMPETLGERPQERLSLGVDAAKATARFCAAATSTSISRSALPPIPGLIAWLSAAPFVLQNIYGLTPLMLFVPSLDRVRSAI